MLGKLKTKMRTIIDRIIEASHTKTPAPELQKSFYKFKNNDLITFNHKEKFEYDFKSKEKTLFFNSENFANLFSLEIIENMFINAEYTKVEKRYHKV